MNDLPRSLLKCMSKIYLRGIISPRLPSRANLHLDKQLDNDLQSLNLHALDRKKEYNRLKFEADHKEKILEKMERDLEQQIKGAEVSQELRDQLQSKKTDYKEISKALDSEINYQNVLKCMLTDRKKSLVDATKPIQEVKYKNGKMNHMINSAHLKLNRTKQENLDIVHSIETIESIRLNNREEYDRNVKQLESKHVEKEAILNLLKQTQLKNDIYQQIQQKEKIVEELEIISHRNEWEENLVKEMKELESFYDKEEMKFKEIQKHTSVSSVEELLNYHTYLNTTTQNLQATIQYTLTRLETLNTTRNSLKSQLNIQMFQLEPMPDYTQRDIECLETGLADKHRLLEKKEEELRKAQTLISYTCGSFSRIGAQLLQSPAVDIKPVNIDNYLSILSMKLDQVLTNLYNREIPYLRDSVNSSLKFSIPPSYLKINPLQILPAEYKAASEDSVVFKCSVPGDGLYTIVDKFDRLISKPI